MYVKLCKLAVMLVDVIVTLLSGVMMLLAFVHVSSTVLVSTAEVIVTEQMISCISPILPLKNPLGWVDILGTGTVWKHFNHNNKYIMLILLEVLHTCMSIIFQTAQLKNYKLNVYISVLPIEC